MKGRGLEKGNKWAKTKEEPEKKLLFNYLLNIDKVEYILYIRRLNKLYPNLMYKCDCPTRKLETRISS